MNTRKDMDQTTISKMRDVIDAVSRLEQEALADGDQSRARIFEDVRERAGRVISFEEKRREMAARGFRAGQALPAELVARRQWNYVTVGLLVLMLAVLGLLVTSCSMPDPLPGDRPATFGEVERAPFYFEARYVAPFAADYWRTWRGDAAVELLPAQAGQGLLPASAELGDGFEGLEGCLDSSLEGAWILEPDGTFSTALVSTTGTTVELHGRFVAQSYRVSEQVTRYRVVGSGTWEATRGPGCGVDDFQGGTAGAWTAEQVDVLPLEAEAQREPRARLLVVREDGQVTTVTGPRSAVVGLAKGTRP